MPPPCENVPLATIPPAITVAEPTPSLENNPPITAEMQQRVFADLVERISSIYLYPDFNGRDWPGLVSKYQAKIDSGLDTEEFYTEMGNFISELGDEHSSFESPVQVAALQAQMAGQNDYVGIGVLMKPLPEKGRVTILAVLPESSAQHGGLKHHDSILAVDGIPIAENGEVYPRRVRGPECSMVVLTVQSPGEPPREVAFVRHRITTPLPIEARLVPNAAGARIGYIFIPTFSDETIPQQVQEALDAFGPLDGLIIDNRMNGGGSSRVLEPILGLFTSGTVGHFISRDSTRALDVTTNEIHNSQNVPLVILIGEDTVSFAEVFSGALQDIGRAKIVGQTTLGNVETLHGFNFEDGSQVWIAAERFEPLVSHADWEKNGIVPDVIAFADWDTFTFETDPAVAAALQLLENQ